MMDAMKHGETSELIIRNIRIIEQAYAMASALDNDMCVHIERLFQDMLKETEWVKELPSAKKGQFSDKDSWVALKKWRVANGKPDEFYAWFKIFDQDHEESEEFYITQLCKQGSSRIGISWEVDHALLFQKDGKKSPWAMWKSFAENQNKIHSRLEELGFNYKDGTWFLPMEVDIENIATACRNGALENVLRRVIERCVESIKEAAIEFDAIIKKARKG